MVVVFVAVVCPFKEWYCVIPDSFPNLSSMAASEHVFINHLTLFLYGNSMAPRIENERPPLDSWRLTAWIVHLHTPALKESDIGTHQMMHASGPSCASVVNTGISSTRQSRGVQEFRNASTYAMAKEIIQKKQLFSTPTATPPCLAHPSSCCNCRHSLCNRCRSISFVSSMDVQSVSHEQSKIHPPALSQCRQSFIFLLQFLAVEH